MSAYDFGYIPAGQFIERTANALHTMEALERHRGHFYNWYDTQSLQPLQPVYISTVDSGNLAGHLLTLRQGLLALPDDPILGTRVFEGISDTVRILMDMGGKTVYYRYRETVYHIAVLRRKVGDGATSITVDGIPQQGIAIALVDDRQEHSVEVRVVADEIITGPR